jgi:hypothetical protein
LCLALGAAGCTATPPPVPLPAPADPAAQVPPSRYRPVTTGTQTFEPVEPLPWQDLNRKVTPPPDTKGQKQ